MIASAYDPDLSRFTSGWRRSATWLRNMGCARCSSSFRGRWFPDLSAALRFVEAAERPALGILVDTLHFNRSASTLDELDRISASRLPFVHVADAPVQESYTTEELLHAGRVERLPPARAASILSASSVICLRISPWRWKFR